MHGSVRVTAPTVFHGPSRGRNPAADRRHNGCSLSSRMMFRMPYGRPSSMMSRCIACQAHPRRVAKVTRQIEREVSDLLLRDKVLLGVTGGTSRSVGGDSADEDLLLMGGAGSKPLCSCSGVVVSNDLQVVKIYLSVLTDDASAKRDVVERCQGLSGYVRRRLGERVRLRLTPEVRFMHDDAIDRGERVLKLLDTLNNGDTVNSGDSNGGETRAQADAMSKGSEDTSEGFFDLGTAKDADKDGQQADNPFLEGVGDSEYDDMPQTDTFFSADMFPDAVPQVEMAEIAEKESRGRKGGRHPAELRKRYTRKRQ